MILIFCISLIVFVSIWKIANRPKKPKYFTASYTSVKSTPNKFEKKILKELSRSIQKDIDEIINHRNT